MLVSLHDEDGDLIVISTVSIREISPYGTEHIRIFCDDGDYWIVPGTVEEMMIRLNRVGDHIFPI